MRERERTSKSFLLNVLLVICAILAFTACSSDSDEPATQTIQTITLDEIIEKTLEDANYNFWNDLPNANFYVPNEAVDLPSEFPNGHEVVDATATADRATDKLKQGNDTSIENRVCSYDNSLCRFKGHYISHSDNEISATLYIGSLEYNSKSYSIVYATYYDRTETKMTEYLCIDDTVYDSSTT